MNQERLKIIVVCIFSAVVFGLVFVLAFSEEALNFLAQYEFYFVVFLLIFTTFPAWYFLYSKFFIAPLKGLMGNPKAGKRILFWFLSVILGIFMLSLLLPSFWWFQLLLQRLGV